MPFPLCQFLSLRTSQLCKTPCLRPWRNDRQHWLRMTGPPYTEKAQPEQQASSYFLLCFLAVCGVLLPMRSQVLEPSLSKPRVSVMLSFTLWVKARQVPNLERMWILCKDFILQNLSSVVSPAESRCRRCRMCRRCPLYVPTLGWGRYQASSSV